MSKVLNRKTRMLGAPYPPTQRRVPASRLLFRKWDGPGKVSPVAVRITATPHYRMVKKVINNNMQFNANDPQIQEYDSYTRSEAEGMKLLPGQRAHSAEQFYANIVKWRSEGLNTEANTVKVFPYGNTYFITDGAHRAAFAAATNQEVCIKKTPNPEWPKITQIVEPMEVDD
jgi:hypothetical protein